MISDDEGCLYIAELLLSGDPEKEREADAILRTAKGNTSDVLRRAVERAQAKYQTSTTAMSVMVAALSGVPQITVYIFLAVGMTFWLACLFTFVIMAGLFLWLVHRRQHAKHRFYAIVLELARRDPIRGVGPLLDLWFPLAKPNRYKRLADVDVMLSSALLKLFASPTLPLDSEQALRLRNKLDAVSKQGSRRRPTPDFSDVRADILVTLIQFLARSPDTQDRAVVERFVARRAVGTNRLLVQGAARDCLEAANREYSPHHTAMLTGQPLLSSTVPVPAQTPAVAPVLQQGRKP